MSEHKDLHLDSLEIENFRLFRHLVIEKLGRVNLIVGKNNVGKTSLLEALWIYAERGNPNRLNQSISLRHEDFRIPFGINGASETLNTRPAIRHIFTDRPAIELGNKLDISIGSAKENSKDLDISLEWHVHYSSSEGETQIMPYRKDTESPVNHQLILGIRINLGEDIDSTSRNSYFYDFHQERLHTPLMPTSTIPNIFVSSGGFNLTPTASGWDNVVITDLEYEVIQALQIIEPDIERLSFISSYHNGDSEDRIPFVKLRSYTNRPYTTWIPLRSLGEGTQRILDIIVALVNAKNGFLFIDEVENGLHYSSQTRLWNLLLRVAEQLNVQIFATTHNWDCVEAFQKAMVETSGTSADMSPDGMLIRLQKQGENIVPILFDKNRLSIAVREEIEIR